MNNNLLTVVLTFSISIFSQNTFSEPENVVLDYSDVRKLTFYFDGLIADTKVENGALVNRNQLLAQLDNKILQHAIKKAKADLAFIRATYKQVKQDHARALELFDRDILSQVEMDKSINLLAKNEASYNAKLASLDILTTKKSYYKLIAPYAGIVLDNPFYKGMLIKNNYKPFTTIKLAAQNKIQFIIKSSNLNAKKAIKVNVNKIKYSAFLQGFTFKEDRFHNVYQIQSTNAYLLVGNTVKVIGK